MDERITRRTVVKFGLMASGAFPAIGLIGGRARAAGELVPLDPKDPQAVTLGFIDDAAKVDVKANTSYVRGQTCANCEQFQGPRDAARGGCVLFAGKSVPAGGWCKVWRRVF